MTAALPWLASRRSPCCSYPPNIQALGMERIAFGRRSRPKEALERSNGIKNGIQKQKERSLTRESQAI